MKIVTGFSLLSLLACTGAFAPPSTVTQAPTATSNTELQSSFIGGRRYGGYGGYGRGGYGGGYGYNDQYQFKGNSRTGTSVSERDVLYNTPSTMYDNVNGRNLGSGGTGYTATEVENMRGQQYGGYGGYGYGYGGRGGYGPYSNGYRNGMGYNTRGYNNMYYSNNYRPNIRNNYAGNLMLRNRSSPLSRAGYGYGTGYGYDIAPRKFNDEMELPNGYIMPKIDVQGDSLKTWAIMNPLVEQVQVFLKTEGRPLNANLELWQGPDNTPQKVSCVLSRAKRGVLLQSSATVH
jgi:hypothetical protein